MQREKRGRETESERDRQTDRQREEAGVLLSGNVISSSKA